MSDMIPFFASHILIILGIIAFFVIPVVRAKRKTPDIRPRLDIACIYTNIILAVLYLPLSLVCSLLGMVSEGYMDATPIQSFLCDAIMNLGFYTFLVCIGAIASSVLLRLRGQSLQGFWYQFFGLFHFLFLILLMILLDYV